MKLKVSKKYFNRRIILFAIYNLVYVLYMTGKLPRSANLLSLGLFTFVCCFDLLQKRKYRYVKEIKLIIVPIIVMILISFVKQVYYNDLSLSRLSNILYIILPAIDAFAIINTAKDKKELEEYVYIMFIRMVMLFLLQNWGNFTVNALRAITFSNSDSSVFESSMAHELFFMVIVFKYLKKDKYAIISAILCMLCFKRLSFLLSIVVLVFYNRIPKDKPVNKILLRCMKVFFILTPFVILFLVSDSGRLMFSRVFGLDINVFTTGRVYYINLVKSHMPYFAGYGSTHEYLAKVYRDDYVTSIHCDVVRIMWECSLVSLIVYINNMIELVKKNYVLFFIMMYCLLECVVSHFMEGMTSWLLIYIFIYLVNSDHQTVRDETEQGYGNRRKASKESFA